MAVLCVDANGDLVAESLHQFTDKSLALGRSRADDHAAHADGQRPLDRVTRPHTSTKLNFYAERGDSLDFGEVLRFSRERTIEIDHVDPFAASLLESRSNLGRIFKVNRFLVGATLRQPHTAATLDIDGGINRHKAQRSIKPPPRAKAFFRFASPRHHLPRFPHV